MQNCAWFFSLTFSQRNIRANSGNSGELHSANSGETNGRTPLGTPRNRTNAAQPYNPVGTGSGSPHLIGETFRQPEKFRLSFSSSSILYFLGFQATQHWQAAAITLHETRQQCNMYSRTCSAINHRGSPTQSLGLDFSPTASRKALRAAHAILGRSRARG